MEILSYQRQCSFLGDNEKEEPAVPAKVFKFISFLPRKLAFVNSFQKLDIYI